MNALSSYSFPQIRMRSWPIDREMPTWLSVQILQRQEVLNSTEFCWTSRVCRIGIQFLEKFPRDLSGLTSSEVLQKFDTRRRHRDNTRIVQEMAMRYLIFLQACILTRATAFILSGEDRFGRLVSRGKQTTIAAYRHDEITEVGYAVSVEKPLGVVFGENPEPYRGLVVDKVEKELNGGQAGLRVGDQLLAINGEVVIGGDFDGTMDLLINAPSSLYLELYRGSVKQLYIILKNMREAAGEPEDEEDEGDIVMDESYESPVQIDVSGYREDKERDESLTPGDFLNAMKKAGSKILEKREDDQPPASKKEEKKGGFFGGMFSPGETIQLDGDDAKGLK